MSCFRHVLRTEGDNLTKDSSGMHVGRTCQRLSTKKMDI